MARADVIIVGAGIIGASVAFHLAQRGVTRVLLLERGMPAGEATGRSSGLLLGHHTYPAQARLVQAGLETYRNWADVVGGDCGFVQTGYVQLFPERDRPQVVANVAMLQGLGVETVELPRAALHDLEPAWNVADIGTVVYEPQSGYADPTAAANGFLQAARNRGARLLTNHPAQELLTSGGRVTGVRAGNETFQAAAVVICAGAWAGKVAARVDIALPLQPVRHQVLHLRRPAPLSAGHLTCFDALLDIYFRPETGNLTLVANRGPDEPITDPDHFDQGAERRYSEWIGERISRRIPAMEDATMQSGYSGVYTLSPDGQMLLGALPLAGLYCACGCSGYGFMMAPGVGLAMAETITTGSSALDITCFDPLRFARGELLHGPHDYDEPHPVDSFHTHETEQLLPWRRGE